MLYKTDVPGLVTDGKGVVINRDLTQYQTLVERRKTKLEGESLREEVGSLRESVADLTALVRKLLEDKK